MYTYICIYVYLCLNADKNKYINKYLIKIINCGTEILQLLQGKTGFVARPFNQNANDYKTVQCTYVELFELHIVWFPHKFLQIISMVTFCGILYEKI